MTQLTDSQLVAVARQGGFSQGTGLDGNGLIWAVAVALAESAGKTDAIGYNPGPPRSYDRGLWQINNYWHPEVSAATAFDPYGCAAAAYRISNGGRSWTQWATYNNGSAQNRYARAATAVGGAPYGGPPIAAGMPGAVSQSANATSIIDAALAFARAQLGDPYVYGANGPDEWDCSSLTQASYAAGGLALPRTAALQYAATPQVDINNPQPGDLAFQYMGADDRQDHVGIYEANGVMIVAPHTGDVVKRQAYSVFPGRALTRPTGVAMPGAFQQITGCLPPARTPTNGDLTISIDDELFGDLGVIRIATAHFMAPGSSSHGGIRPCAETEPV